MQPRAYSILAAAFICLACANAQAAKGPARTVRVPMGDTTAAFRLIEPKAERIDYPDFYIMETEVTNQQYKQFLAATRRTKDDTDVLKIVEERDKSHRFSTGDVPYRVEDPTCIWKNGEYPRGQESFPVSLVTLDDANDFCKWLSDTKSGLGIFRLPTWNEWMLAAYGRERKYPWGDNWDETRVHMSYGFKYPGYPKRTEDVKARPKGRTPQGLFGMLGNAAELIQADDPTNANYLNLGARWMGGGFTHGAYVEMFKENRTPLEPRRDYWGYSHHATLRECDLGFRVVLDPTKDHSLLKRPRLFKQGTKDWMIEDK